MKVFMRHIYFYDLSDVDIIVITIMSLLVQCRIKVLGYAGPCKKTTRPLSVVNITIVSDVTRKAAG